MGLERRLLSFAWIVGKRFFNCILISLRVTNGGRLLQAQESILMPDRTNTPSCIYSPAMLHRNSPWSLRSSIAFKPRGTFQVTFPNRWKQTVHRGSRSCAQHFYWISQLAHSYKSEVCKLNLGGWPTVCFDQPWFYILKSYPKGRNKIGNKWPHIVPKDNNIYTMTQSRKCFRWRK